jgi:DNA-binding GntR family transcriptional regulator
MQATPIADPHTNTHLHRESLGSQIAHQLRQDILLGRLAPGTQISQRALCEAYGTSRMPVRDAMRQLTHEGLIVNLPSGHAVAAALTVHDIEDSYSVEATVHSRTARRATVNAALDDLAVLESLHERMLEATKRRDLQTVADLNWQFHRHINLLARSPKLLALVRAVSLGIPRQYLMVMPEWADRSNNDHSEIIEAMRRKDLQAVDVAVRRHVEEAGNNLVGHLSSKGFISPDDDGV